MAGDVQRFSVVSEVVFGIGSNIVELVQVIRQPAIENEEKPDSLSSKGLQLGVGRKVGERHNLIFSTIKRNGFQEHRKLGLLCFGELLLAAGNNQWDLRVN